MTAIAHYNDVLNDNMIAAWWPPRGRRPGGPRLRSEGGTAVAMVLRHRHSHDLDFMTLAPFDSRAVAAKLLSSAARAAYKDDDRPHIAKVAYHGVPVTVMRDLRGFVKGHATQLADPSVVDGIAVGSVPDLMATKLEVIQHRRQGRNYIDIAAMDRAGACTIEDGQRYHKQRYTPTVTYEETLRIARLATSPPPTDPDPAFDCHLIDAARHLAARRRAVLDWALQSGQRPRPPPPPPPRTRTLTHDNGHAGDRFARQHSHPYLLLDHQGRVLPQPTVQASACSITNLASPEARRRPRARRCRRPVVEVPARAGRC